MKKRIFAVLLALTLVLGLIPTYSAQVEATDTEKINITSAVGLEGVTWASGYGMDTLYDGNITTGKYFIGATYATEAGPEGGAYAELTLEKTSLVSEIDLYTRIASGANAGCPKEFTVSAYTGSGWTQVATGSDADLESYTSGVGLIKVNFEPVLCSKVKITITKLGKDGNAYCLRMNEIEVRGTSAKLAATASTNMSVGWADNAGLSIDKVCDGNITGTFFAGATYATEAGPEGGAYVELALKKASYVSEVDLYTRIASGANAGCPKEFTVSAYTGSGWTQVATGSDADVKSYTSGVGLIKVNFDPVLCSKVKITITKFGKDGNNYCARMNEIEIYGTEFVDARVNAALNGTVDMECPDWAQKAYGPGKLVDGITTAGNLGTTSGSADAAVQKDVKIVFKDGAYEINQINLVPAKQTSSDKTCFPKDFTVSVWNGQTWVQVAAKTGYTSDGSIVSLTFNAVVCNGILIECTKLSTADDGKYVLMMSEVEALGTKSTASLAAPQDKKDETGGEQPPVGTRVNAALNGTVDMECPEWAQKSYGPGKLVDGIATAGQLATTDASDTAAVQKDVKIVFKDGAYEIDQISLIPAKNGFPQDFTLSVWNGQKWVQVASKTGYKDNGKTLILTFDKVLCNAIKLTATKLGAIEDGKYALRMAEIEAYGVKSSASLSKPPVSSGATQGGSASAPEVTIDNTKNIALNCPTSVIHDHTQWGAGVTNINDGNLKTFMATDDTVYEKGDVLWAEINLLRNYSIDTVILYARNKTEGLPYDFTISIFYDGEWIEAVTKKDFAVDAQAAAYEIKFPAVIGNKIRISTDNFRQTYDKKNSFCLCELAVYGTPVKGNYVLPNENVVSGNTLFTATSSLEDSGYFIKHLYDRDLTTEWSSIPTTTAEEKQVLELDFRNTLQVGEILLKPSWKGSGFPVDFTISVLENEKWVEVYSVTDYKKPVDEAIQKFSFEPREISKIRITVTKQAAEGGVYVFKLDEVMAYPYATGDDFDLDAIATEENKDDALEDVSEETVVEEKIYEEPVKETAVEDNFFSDEDDLPSDEVAEITKGTSITGNIESDGSVNLYGKIKGDIKCKGKLIVTGRISGVSHAREIFANNAKIEGDVHSTGTIKVGNGSIIVGNVYATSAVIGGAIRGDIDVHGPVIVDGTAVVQGNIKSRSVQINNGAVIEGYCSQCYADIDYKSLFEDTFSEM